MCVNDSPSLLLVFVVCVSSARTKSALTGMPLILLNAFTLLFSEKRGHYLQNHLLRPLEKCVYPNATSCNKATQRLILVVSSCVVGGVLLCISLPLDIKYNKYAGGGRLFFKQRRSRIVYNNSVYYINRHVNHERDRSIFSWIAVKRITRLL